MTLTFLRTIPQADGVIMFIFAPDQPTSWIAGQSIRLELRAGFGLAERRFTIAASPTEGTIAIATRFSNSDFKQALAALQPGAKINGYAIEGDFTWGNHNLPRLFVASGIGVTPFYAIIKDRVLTAQPIPATLLYATPRRDIPFATELQNVQMLHPEFTLHLLSATRLHAGHIVQLVPNLLAHQVYVSGPSAMVDTISAALTQANLPAEQLNRDWFTGNLGAES